MRLSLAELMEPDQMNRYVERGTLTGERGGS
jgi:hypothetical protein